jgi:hypothetical protein
MQLDPQSKSQQTWALTRKRESGVVQAFRFGKKSSDVVTFWIGSIASFKKDLDKTAPKVGPDPPRRFMDNAPVPE